MDRQYSRQRRVVYLAPQSWSGRLAAVLTGIVLIILAVFFFAIFMAVFSMLAVVVIVRALWLGRQVRGEGDETLEAEYSVDVESERQGWGQEEGERRLEQHHRDPDSD